MLLVLTTPLVTIFTFVLFHQIHSISHLPTLHDGSILGARSPLAPHPSPLTCAPFPPSAPSPAEPRTASS